MKRFSIFSLLFALFGLLGCSEDTPVTPQEQPVADPELTLEKTEIEVPAQGGTFTLRYTLEGAVEGAGLKASVQHEAWVTSVDTSVVGEITVVVKPSYEPEARSCRVELIYPGLYPNPLFVVKQAKGMERSFAFELKSVMSNTIVMDVYPKDKTMPYVFMLGKKSYMEEDNLLEDDAAQIASDLEVLNDFGAAFGGTAQDVISAFMYEGDQLSYAWNGVERNTEYVAYAYGFDVATMQPLTEVCRVEIKTLDVQDFIVDFDLQVKTDGPNCTFDIAPVNYDGYYFFGVFAAADVPQGSDPDLVRSYCEAAWEEEKALYSPFFDSAEDGLRFIFKELAYSGKCHFEAELAAETEYVLWAVGMNNEALVNTAPVLKYFTTGKANQSENRFEITVSDIKARKATITVEPSNNDPFVAVFVKADRFAGMTDDQIMDEVCTSWNYSLADKAFTTTVEDLTPSTRYEILVFGINGGRPSTGLTRKSFFTTEAIVSQAKFEVSFDTFYDVDELTALNPVWGDYDQYDLLLQYQITADETVAAVYLDVLETELFNYYKPAELEEALVSGDPVEPGELVLLNYDTPFIFFAIAEDVEGNFTEFWSSPEVLFKRENRSPAEELDGQLQTRQRTALRPISALKAQPQSPRSMSELLTIE